MNELERTEPPYTVDDGGQSQSLRYSHLQGTCSARALAIAGRISFDTAFNELLTWERNQEGSEELLEGQGVAFERWARKVGFIRYWLDHPEAVHPYAPFGMDAGPPISLVRRTIWLRWIPLPSIKGRPRIRPYELPAITRGGRYIASSTGHVEAWVDGVHRDREGIFDEVSRSRVIYGLWQVCEVHARERLWKASKVWMTADHEADQADLGVVCAPDEEQAYRQASELFETKVGSRRMDLLVEALDAP